MNPADEAQGNCAEEAARLMLALKASNEGIWDWWTGQREIFYSRRILEFLQCSASSAPNIFIEPHEMIFPEDRERFASALANALDPGGPELFSIDCRIKTGGDDWLWLRIRGTVVRGRGGEAQRIAGSMIDISRRKAAEAQIEEERHILRTLIDRVPLQVYFKDLASRFVLVNRQMAEWNGQPSPASVVGKHDRDFFASAHWKEAEADEKQIMASGKAITGKLEHEVREDGQETWVLSSKFPWIDRSGSIRGTFGVSSDVTELVEAKQQADSYAAELAIRNQAYEEELQLAREIQQTLAGSSFPEIGRNGMSLRFGARYLPITGMAGDFFEILRISDDTAGVLICDVMGHGVRSALVVAMLRGLLEKQRRSAADPSAFLRGLNNGLNSILDRAGATMFATAFYAVVDLGAGTLRYACAGHPGAIATGRGGVQQLACARGEKGPGLGLIAKAEYPAGQADLADISRLLLFTDGILEAENEEGEPFLEERLMSTATESAGDTLEGMLDHVLNRVLHYSEGHHFDDDVCLLGVELMPHPAAVKC